MTETRSRTGADVRPGAGETILDVRDLRVYYHTRAAPVKAVDGVSFDLARGRAARTGRRVGVGQVDDRAGAAADDQAAGPDRGRRRCCSTGRDLLSLPEEEMRQVAPGGIALVAQGAMNSLNPVTRVRDQIVDALDAITASA